MATDAHSAAPWSPSRSQDFGNDVVDVRAGHPSSDAGVRRRVSRLRRARELLSALVHFVGWTTGLVFGDVIKDRLFGVGPVAAPWAVGGVATLLVGRRLRGEGVPLEALGWPQAMAIGVAQVAALWPGVSRSLVTIVAGVAIGLSLSAAVESASCLAS